MKKIFFLLTTYYLLLTTASAQNPWTGNELRLQGKAQTKVKRIQNPMTGVIFYRLSDSTVCVRNPNNSVVELGPGGGYLPDSLGLDHYTLSIIGSNSVNLLHDSLVLSNDTLSILNSNSVVLPTDYSPWDTAGTDIVQKDNTLNVVVDNTLTADSVSAAYKLPNGSSNTQVLFNNAGVIKGDTGMVYNATNNKLTVDSIAATNITSATFTPALTDQTNIDTSTVNTDAMYHKINGIVTVQYSVNVDATTTATLTELRVSLPIAANPSAANAGQGVFYDNGAPVPALVTPVDANTVRIRFVPVATDSQLLNFSIMYRIN